VSKLNITLKKLILFSALSVVLGVSLVYAMSYEFKPENSRPALSLLQGSQPSGGATASAIIAHIIVFGYSSNAGGFVQASVTIIGPESPYYAFGNSSMTVETLVNQTLNGTTTADLQSPLSFAVMPGVYSIVGTYGSAAPHNTMVNVTESGSYAEVVLSFGSSPPPPLGHIIVVATYLHRGANAGPLPFLEYVQASVTITGSETLNGTTSTDEWNPTVFTVTPGAYSVFATYGSATQNATVTVTAGSFAEVTFGVNP
jgi:hypothetical protein